jgi:ectoine hydroxylase-related dioxygenase (phytanoyl-CoA dioxygenase family)
MNKTLNEEMGWTIIDYDQNIFPFDKIIEKDLLNFLREEHNSTIDKLENLHLSDLVADDLEIVRQKIFSTFREEKFQGHYKKFAKMLIDTHADENALVQRLPTPRIQPPNFMTTSFHSDSWYGHSQSTNSFWVPLTDVSENNTLHMATSREMSNKMMEKLLRGNYSLSTINEMCMDIAKPSKVKKGQVLTFAPNMIHGAKVSRSEFTRVSFDFRIVNSDKDLGYKPISNYYRYCDLDKDVFENTKNRFGQNTSQQFLSYSNRCSGVNPKSQLMLCNCVAKDRGISIQRNESEIYAFDHLPVLRHYLSDETPMFDGVVAAEDILVTSVADRDLIIKRI